MDVLQVYCYLFTEPLVYYDVDIFFIHILGSITDIEFGCRYNLLSMLTGLNNV